MDPPENLQMLLYRCEATNVRDQVTDRITAPEIYELLETRTSGAYARARYASGGGIGDHVLVSLIRIGSEWNLVGAMLANRSLEDASRGDVSIVTPEGVENHLVEGRSMMIFGAWSYDPGSSRL